MGRLSLSKLKLSLLSLAVVISAFCMLAHTWHQSLWQDLLAERIEDISLIPTIFLVSEIPASHQLTKRVIEGQTPRDALAINAAKGSLSVQDQVGDELQKKFPERFLNNNLLGTTLVYFFDIDSAILRDLKHPRLVLHAITGPWKFYVDGKLVEEFSEPRYAAYRSLYIPKSTKPSTRVAFVVENSSSSKIVGPWFRIGLPIQSEFSALWSERMSKYREVVLKVVPAAALLALAFFALLLAANDPSYSDLWAFACLCISLAVLVWSESPYYFMAFSMDQAYEISAYRALIHSGVIFCTACMTIAYFRLSTQISLSLVGVSFLFNTFILKTHWPLDYLDKKPAWELLNSIDQNLAYILIFSQITGVTFGVWQMIDQHRYFIRSGLEPLAKRMLQRYWESALYIVMMAGMVYAYAKFLPVRSTSQELDLFYLYGLLPAIAMFYMFFNMINAAARFKQRFTPQLNMADHFLLQFGAKAVDRTYHAALTVFDLQGFKALDRLRYVSPEASAQVDALLTNIEHDLLALIPRGRELFRYKSNGDEFIMLLYAKDAKQSQDIYLQMLQIWTDKHAGLLRSWQGQLVAGFPDSKIELGMHVLMCTCSDVKITVRGPADSPIARPDFLSSRFSQLTAAFKDSTATHIAVYRDDLALLHPAQPFEAYAGSESIGYLNLDSNQTAKNLPAA